MKMIKRVIALLLTAVMLVQPLAFAANVTDFYDFPNDWSTEAMTAAVKNDLLRGDGNGFINPGRNLTRAELAAIMVRAFGATVMSKEQKFSDVKSSDWFYNDVYKAVQMQIMQGTGDTTFAPQASITRQEVFTVVARALCLTDGNSAVLGKFSDNNEISDWAKAPIAALIENNYINGYPNGTLDPLGKITRAELAQLLHNLFRTYISVSGYHMSVAEGSVVVRTSDVHIENLTINGDLIIADGVGNGNFDLKSVTVNGRILARGGEGAVTFKDVKVTNGVVIFDPNGIVNFKNYRDEAPFKKLTELTPANFLKKPQDNGYVGGGTGGSGGTGDTETPDTINTTITLTAPVRGESPQTTIDSETYTARVTWYPAVNGTFAGDVEYTATIRITPKSGYTLAGVAANSYTVNGNATTHGANASTVSFTFPKTEPAAIDTAITLDAPVAGQRPQTSINAATYTATVEWTPAVNGTFAYNTDYAAIITLTPKAGYTLDGVEANSYTVNGNAITHVANANIVTYTFQNTGLQVIDTAITLEAPVAGEVPQTTINADTYTADVDWSPTVGGTFDYYKDYTATITITPKTGYTLTGVPANSYRVNGNATTHAANASEVSYTFSKTEKKPINRTLPLEIPAVGNVPMTSFSGEGYTATVTWSPAHPTFEYGTDYVATITLDLEEGYRVPDEAYIVSGADGVVTNGNKTVVTATFEKFGSTPITGANFVIDAPVAGQAPQTTLDAPTYTATINWSPAVNGTFDYNTVYTAEISITPKDGYTVNGVPANSYTVNGNATTHGANANVVTYTFPVTAPAVIDTAITLDAPVAGEMPQTTIDAHTYTATVEWTPTVGGTFGYYQDYTATITITPKTGYTLTGVAANSYTVNGNATIHSANAGTVVYTFPKTEPAVIDTAITLDAPVAGEVPQTTIDALTYTAVVEWTPVVSGTFAYYTDYSATIKITAKEGYTVAGVGANSYTVNGDAITHVAGSNIVTYTFPKTENAVIDTEINLTVPVAGEVPQTTIDAETYTATVEWTPAVNGTFAHYEVYTAKITITPKTGYTLTGVAANSYKVNGISINHAANASVVEYTFERTAPAVIGTEITLDAPVAGEVPQTTIDAPTYTAVVEWTPTVGGTFGYYTEYKATITIEPKTGYTVTGVEANSYTVNGNATVHPADANVVEYTFDYTEKQPIGNGISFALPIPGETPVTSFTGEGYTANVSWSGELRGGKFKYDVEYTATVTITPNTGYTYPVESEYVWAGAGNIKSIATSADKKQVTVGFYETKSTDINGTLSITAPVANKVCTQPAGTVLTGTGYSATITGWSDGFLAENKFKYGTEYTVTLEVTLVDGYSIPASGFDVAGAAEVTNTPVDANGKTTVTVKFPATDNLVGKEINVIAPVANAVNTSNTVTGDGFTATIVWNPAVAVGGKFAYDTTYTATITVTPNTGYTLDGVSEDYFVIDSAESTSNAANSGTVTATFAKTDALVDDEINVTVPVAYEINASNTVTGDGFTAEVVWTPVLNAGDRFAYDTVYTATITVTPDAGYTISGITANYFTVPGAVSVSNDENSGTVTATFAKTDKLVGNTINVTKPEAGIVNTSNTVSGDGFTANIEWSPAVGAGTAFDYNTVYTATVTVTPKTGYTLSGVSEDYFVINNAVSASNDENSGTVTATFERTAKRIGNSLTITQPKAHADTLETAITGEGFTGTVSWTPNPVLTGTYYNYSTEYTAKVTITPETGYTVDGIPATSNFFTVSLADPAGFVQIKDGFVPQTVITTSGGVKVATVEIAFTETEQSLGVDLGEEKPTPAKTEEEFKNTINQAVISNTNEDGVNKISNASSELADNTDTVDRWLEEARNSGATIYDVQTVSLLALEEESIKYGTQYYAKITVTAAEGYTARGIMENPFTVENAEIVAWWVDPTSDGDRAVVIVKFPPTLQKVKTELEITAPVPEATPDTKEVDESYLGGETAVNWFVKDKNTNQWVAHTGKFWYNREYKAELTITPADGYTTEGFDVNSFEVIDNATAASVKFDTATSKVTVEYQVTDKKEINSVLGLTKPVVHAVPATSFSGEGYTAAVVWTPADTTFKYDTVYVATVQLTLEDDYKVPAGDYTVADSESVDATTDKLTVNVTYAAIETEPIHTDFTLTAPKAAGTPATSISCGDADGCYTADVEWFCYENGAFVPFTGTEFGYNRVYKAKISIEPIDGYSTLRVPANTYTVNGEQVIHDEGADEFEFTFNATEKKKIDKTLPLEIPEIDVTPMYTFSGEGYTATVEWNLEAGETVFGYNKEYVATITIDLEDDYTVPAENYVVNGSKSVSADADKLVVTVTFAKLGLEPIPHRNFVIPVPVAGETPVTNIACGETDGCYTATVTWYYNNNGGFVQFNGTTFDYYTEYKAEITITPSDDHTVVGVPANSYTVNGNATVHPADANVVSYIFEPTEKKKIDNNLAVTAPEIGETPITTLTGEGYTATVEWTPADTVFGYDKEYVATVEITLEEGYTVPDGNYVVSGSANVEADTDKTVVTVTFEEIQSQTIHTDFVLTAPVAGETPETTILCSDSCYTANVVWYYDDNGTFVQFTGTEFGYNTVYKAQITIVPADGYSTIRVPANTYTLNSETVTHDAGVDEFEFTFPETENEYIVRFFDGYGQYFEDATLYNADLNEAEGVYTVKEGTFPHEITAYDGVDVLDTEFGFIRDYSMLLSGDAKFGVDAVDERYKNNEIHEIKNTYWYVKDGVWTEFDSTVELEPGITNVFINSQFVDLKIEVPKIADFSLDLKTNYEVDGRVADVFKDIIFAEGNEQNIIHIFSDEEITAKLLEKLDEKDIIDADGNILNQHREIYLVDVLGEARLKSMIDEVVGDAIAGDGDIVGEIIERFETFDDSQKDNVVTAFHKLFESILEKDLDDTMKTEVRAVVYDFFDAMSLEDIIAIANAHIGHMIENEREAEVKTLMEDMLQVYKDADYDGLKAYVATFIKENKGNSDISTELTKYIKSEIKAGNLNDELKGYIAGYDRYDTVVEFVAGEDLETLVTALGLKTDVDFVKSAIYSAIDLNNADFEEAIRVAAGIEPEVFEQLTNTDIKDAVDEYIAENGISGFSGVIDDAIELVESNSALKTQIINDHIKTISKATVAEKVVEILNSDSSYFDKPVIDNVINYAVAEKLKNIDDGTISDYADTVVGTEGVDDDKFEILSGAYVSVNTSTRETITGDIIEELYEEDDFKKIIDKFVDDIFTAKKIDVEIVEYMVDHLSDASDEAKEDLEILLEDVAHDGVLLGDLAHALGIQEVEEKYEHIEQLIDELCNKKSVTVTADRAFMFDAILAKFNEFTYENIESKIPEKLLQFLPREVMEKLYNRFLFDEGGYVYKLEKALANAKANEGTEYYVTSYGAVDFNPVTDVVGPVFKFYYEQFENIDNSNRFKELYAEYFLGNPYAVAVKEYFVKDNGEANLEMWFDGTANDYKEEKSGYTLKPFAYTNADGDADTAVKPGRSYMDNVQALSVLSDDAMYYFYNNGYETARNEYLEKIYDKAMEYKEIFEGENGLPTFEELTNKVGKFEDNATAKRVYEFVVRQLKSRGLDKRIISICERIPEDESKKDEAIERTELFYTAGTVADMFDYIKKAKEIIAEKTDKINKIDIVEENGRFSITIDKGDNIVSFLSDFCYDEVTADAIIEYWESEGI